MQVKVRHPDHRNIMTFINGKQVKLENYEGMTDVDTAMELIEGPFGYEWAGPAAEFNPETWTEDKKILTWNHIMPFYEGYGYVAQMMINALKELDVDMRVFYKSSYDYVKSNIMDVLHKERRFDTWGIWHHFWMKPNMLPTEKRAVYTMWESTQLRPEWIPHLNSVDIVFVPCEQNKESFKANGVTTPIYVVEHGVDQEFYFYRPKKKNDVFTFGTMGSLVARKDPELLIKAFRDEFGDAEDVKLVMKDTNKDTELELKYKHHNNIEFIGEKVSPMEVGNLLASFDLAVFPSHGEGFGLGGLQAMGVGTTCACTDWGGFKQYLNPEYNFAIKSSLIDIHKFPSNNTTYSGQWAQADYDDLRRIMRYAYENQEEIHEMGKKAAQWIKEEWNWKRAAKQLIGGIDDYEQSRS